MDVFTGRLRRFSIGSLAALVLTLFAALPAAAIQGPDRNPWLPTVAFSEDGMLVEWDETAALSFGGLFQGDWGYIEKDAFATPEGWDGQVRRARLDVDGHITDYFIFRFEYDVSFTRGRLAEPDVDYKDIYIGVQNLGPLGTLRVGNMKEPYSLQHLTYAGDRVFMEEANSTVFTPGRSFGIMLNHHLFDERMTWAVGGFQKVTDTSSFFGKKGDWDVALRLTGLPYYAEDGRKLIHFGTAYIHSFRDDDHSLTYKQRPEANLADALPKTTLFMTNAQDSVGGEIAANYGPFQFQLETSVVWQNRVGEEATHTKAAYVQTGVFLTGEHRPYDTANGVFTRVRPKNPVSWKGGGWGAWQLSARASYMDTNSNVDFDSPRSETYGEFGVALNWYLRSSVRLDTNYLYLTGNGGSSLFMMRAQIQF
jgi:phosphate-selective porin OprO/OprP